MTNQGQNRTTTKLNKEKVLMGAFEKSPDELKKIRDPFIEFAEALYPTYQKLKETRRTRKGALDKLYAQLIDVKKEFLNKDFIPDANGTLRLTFGRIRGYSPIDAVYYSPITTLNGVIEKTTGEEKRGEERRGEESRGEERRGEESRGEQSRGEERRPRSSRTKILLVGNKPHFEKIEINAPKKREISVAGEERRGGRGEL